MRRATLTVETSVGTIEYEDTGGDGPVLIFLHGLLMDASVWRDVVPEWSRRYRCVLPTLPLGGHRIPLRDDADLSLAALGTLIGELLELAKYVVSVPPRDVLLDWARRAAAFAGPVLVVWASEDRMMPVEHGRRLAELFPDARLVEIGDSYTLLPEDQPGRLTGAIEEFLRATDATVPPSGPQESDQ